MSGRKRRKRSRRKRDRSRASTALGLLILLLAGAGVWYGAQWSEGEGFGVFPTLDGSVDGDEDHGLPHLPPDVRVRVEVLNAGGVRGMAADARDELRDLGFDVVYYGNAPTFDAEDSEVIHRAGDPELARAVANALGIETLRSEPDSTLLLDVTVHLGSSWLARELRGIHRPEADG
ncbi:MAG: LytR family transcriptional regulator [Gemmatimonadales bacterium]|nr:MAG: LytR family transcriptional regulator [Gemmatimonadales bacterium]